MACHIDSTNDMHKVSMSVSTNISVFWISDKCIGFRLSSYHCLHVSFVLAFLFQHGLICNCSFIRMKNRAYTSSHTKIFPNTYLLCYKLCDIPFRIPPSEFNLNPFSSMNWLRLLISLKWDFRWWAEIVTWFSAYPLTRVQAAYSLSLCIH